MDYGRGVRARSKVIHSAVRPRKRSHNTPLALAGLGALAVLASISGGASNASPVEAASRAPAPADPHAIRSVDFGEVAQPGSVCSNGLRFAPPGQIRVQAGRSQVLDLAQLTQLVVDPDTSYGDLDGDGADEAVIRVTCSFGANGAEDTVSVWGLEGDEVVPLASVDAAPEGLTSDLPPAVQGVGVSNGRVVVRWSRYADGDPQCCPSQQARVSYRLEGDELVAVGEPTVSAAPSS
jgi:hypothetical protein